MAVHAATRVEVLPGLGRRGASPSAGGAGPLTMYFYVGLARDGEGADEEQASSSSAKGVLAAVGEPGASGSSLLSEWTSRQIGDFHVEVTASKSGEDEAAGSGVGPGGPSDVTVAFVGKANVRLADVQKELQKVLKAQRASRSRDPPRAPVQQTSLLPNALEAGSNVLFVQVRG